MNPFIQKLEAAADRVKGWGAVDVGNGMTLREALTVDGVPFWDAMVVDLALYRVPNVGNYRRGSRMIELLRPIVAPFRYRSLRDFANGRESAELPRAPRALLLGFSPYMTRDILEPIAQALPRVSDLVPIVLGPSFPPADSPSQVVHRTWSEHWSGASKQRSKALSKALGKRITYLRAIASSQELFRGMNRASRSAIAERLTNAFTQYGRYILVPHAAVAQDVLATLRPEVIISPDVADPRTRLYSLLGAQYGVPTLEVQLGVFGGEATEWRFFQSAGVAVWGAHSRQVLARHGVPESCIHITGSPRHDSLNETSPEQVVGIRRRFDVPESHRLIVLASVYSLNAYQTQDELSVLRAMKRDVFEIVGRTWGIVLIVKPHPLEDLSETRRLGPDFANVIFAEPQEDIRGLISASDGLLTFGSTVTLDALILNKPTVSLAYPGWDWGELFVEGGATEVCVNRSDIEMAVAAMARDGGQSLLERHALERVQFLSEWIGTTRGHASHLIARLTARMALQETDRPRQAALNVLES